MSHSKEGTVQLHVCCSTSLMELSLRLALVNFPTVFIYLSILSGICNQAFGEDICGNPLYEKCDLTETSNDPVEFAPSSLVLPNPLYGDLSDLPGHRTQKTGRLI